jgi:transcriptional regulator with XRE-family HTH domain
MNTNAYAKIEQGRSEPTLSTIKRLSKALKVQASDILGY